MAKEINVGPGGYSTIAEAIENATDFDIIRVAPGYYFEETIVVDKNIKLLGAAAGINPRLKSRPKVESIITSTSPKGILQILAPHVVIDGFIIEGNVDGPGISTSLQFSGFWIQNNIIQNNAFGLYLNSNGEYYTHIKHNIFHKNNQPGLISGSGVYVDTASTNIHIYNNFFTQHQPAASINLSGKSAADRPSNIIISSNEMLADNSILLTNTSNISINQNKMTNTMGSSIFIGGGTDRTSIEHNVLRNSLTNGIYINDFFSGTTNQNIRIVNNSIIGNQTAALNITSNSYKLNDSELKLQASLNWWEGTNGIKAMGENITLVDPDDIVELFPPLMTPPEDSINTRLGIQPAIRITSNSITTIVADIKEAAILTLLGLSDVGQPPIIVNNIPKTWPELRDFHNPNNSTFLGEPDFIWPQLNTIGGEKKYFSTKYSFSSLAEHLVFITSFADNSHRLFVEERHGKTGELIQSITPKEGVSAGDMQPDAGLRTDLEPPYNWQRICQYSSIISPSSPDNVLIITFQVVNYLSQCQFNPAALAFRADIYKLE